MNEFSRLTLPNGVRVLTERMPGSITVAIGLWVDVGSRDETPGEGGVTHYIEHMLFKGTGRRDLFQLARDVNTLGGNFNAFTSPEQLCLHATVIQSDVEAALSTLAEMLLESVFPDQEVENERGVILGEISEYEDQPEDFVEEQFYGALWPGHPLGRPVTGLRKTVERFNRKRLLSYWSEHFSPDRLIVTLAGGIDRRRIAAMTRRLFGGFAEKRSASEGRIRPESKPGLQTTTRDLEQIHFCLGVEGPPRQTPDRYALSVFNALYGGGLGSRLSNEVREKRGLAYSIGASFSSFFDVGCFAIRGSAAPEKLAEVVEVSLEELRKLFRETPPEDEVAAARDQCVRCFLLAQESAGARMTRLGENELAGMEILPASEVVRRLEAVTPQTMQEVIKRHFEGQPVATALVGPLNGHKKMFRSLRLD